MGRFRTDLRELRCLVHLGGPTDTLLDIIHGATIDDTIRFRTGNGDGTFGSSTTLAIGDLSGIQVGDLNGDGFNDLLISRSNGDIFTVRLNNQAGGFSAGVNYATGTNFYELALADLDGDADLDVTLASNSGSNIYRFFDNGAGTLTAAATPVFNGTTNQTGADGFVDLFYTGHTSATWGTIDDFDTETQEIGGFITAYRTIFHDVDGDGEMDILTQNSSNDRLGIMYGVP